MADKTTPRDEPTTATVTVIPAPVTGATAVDPATALPAFTPADIDLSPLDPRQNGVLDALGRIEAAVTKVRRLSLVEGHDKAGTPIVRAGGAGAARDAAGRFTSTRALAQGAEAGGTSGLQQKIRKVKRIEQRVERTLPGGDAPAPGEGGEDASASMATVTVRPVPAAKRATERREDSRATGEATAQAIKEQSTPRAVSEAGQDDEGRPTVRPLTAEDLRKMPLRGDNGRFLSKDEKDGMSQAELAQAKAREQRDKAREDDKTRGVMGRLADATRDTLGGKGDATDAAGTAVGNSYYLAAKEVYGAVDELAGKDSKAQQLYQWAKKKREERAGTREQDDSDNARPAATPDPDKAAKQRQQTADAVESRATADAKQREAAAQQKMATADARESQHRADVKQADYQHADNQESLDDLTKTTEDGFEDVVDAIKRYSGGEGGGGLDIWPGGRGRGGARGGGRRGRRAGARRAGKAGFFRRTWDKLRPGSKASTAAKAGQATKAAKAGSTAAKAAKTTSTAAKAAGNTAQATKKASIASKVGAKAVEAAKATKTGQAVTKTAQVSKTAVQAAKATKVGGAVAKGASTTAKVTGGAAKAGGRLLGAAAAPVTGYLAYQDAKADMAARDDLTEKQKTTVATGSAVGAGGGAAAGAAAGAAIGAAAGTVVPVIGNAIGGVLGGVVGGALGAWGGGSAGRQVGEAVADTMDNVEEEARKALEDREKRLQKEEGKASFKWYNPATWASRGGAGTRKVAPVNQGDYTAGGDQKLANADGFGRVAEKYESSGMGVSTVSKKRSTDKGGVSYGIHQLASDTGTMQAYLDSKEGEQYREQFAGMSAGSQEFTAKYKQIAANDGDAFAESQQAFIKRTHYDPVAEYAKAKGVDTDSEAIQEMLYSQSVQTSGSGNREIIDDAVNRAGPDATNEEMINAMYAARGDYVEPYVTHSAGRGRYKKEIKDVQAIAARERREAAAPEAEPPAPTQATATSTPAPAPGQRQQAAANDPAPPASIAAPVEPRVAGVPVEAIDPAKAQRPAQSSAPPRSLAQAPAAKAAPTPAGPAGNDGKHGKDGTQIRGGTSAPGVNDIQMGFDDTVLTLMAMDRI